MSSPCPATSRRNFAIERDNYIKWLKWLYNRLKVFHCCDNTSASWKETLEYVEKKINEFEEKRYSPVIDLTHVNAHTMYRPVPGSEPSVIAGSDPVVWGPVGVPGFEADPFFPQKAEKALYEQYKARGATFGLNDPKAKP